jgi:hypothetical protein
MIINIRIADAREVFENAIKICFGEYFRKENYIYDGDYYESYEIVNDMARGGLKYSVNDNGVEFKLDGYTIMTWTPTSISEIDETKIAKHMQGYNLVDLYIDFFHEVRRLIDLFVKGEKLK